MEHRTSLLEESNPTRPDFKVRKLAKGVTATKHLFVKNDSFLTQNLRQEACNNNDLASSSKIHFNEAPKKVVTVMRLPHIKGQTTAKKLTVTLTKDFRTRMAPQGAPDRM